nr:hypothetical protein [Tanacetum cinerariifolium]
SGKENGAADALSRRGDETDLGMLSVASTGLSDEQQQAVNTDPEIVALKGRIDLGELGPEGYNIVGGMTHGSVIGGHEGTQKTYQRLSREFYWVRMRRDVAKMVAECDVCQRNKYSNLSPVDLLQPLSLPQRIWEDLTMDFIDGLPKSSGYSVILVVVDRLSKSAHFVPLKHPYTAASVATIFIRVIVRLHRVPKLIISDRDRVFVSHFWREMFKYQGTTLKRSTAYHPQTDGQTEVDRYLRERDRTLAELKSKFLRAQQIMKAQADGKRKDVSLEVGDRVYLKLRPYRQTSVAQRTNQKLAPRYYGPYEVVEWIGQVAYKLKLPSGSVIHPVFHVSQLRKAIGGQQVTSELPAGGDIMENIEPEEVISSRIVDEQRSIILFFHSLTPLWRVVSNGKRGRYRVMGGGGGGVGGGGVGIDKVDTGDD